MDTDKKNLKFCGREFTGKEVALIREVVQTCSGISRSELAHTVCELLEWKRVNRRLKARECKDLLEQLEDQGVLRLPEKKSTKPKKAKPEKAGSEKTGSEKTETDSARNDAVSAENVPACIHYTGSVEAFGPVDIERVTDAAQRLLFRNLVSRYHYLGYKMPYGARLQYLAYVNRPRREVVGCIQFSSPAWRMKARDRYIGWDEATRTRRLQLIVNNSRLLILPRIHNLASTVLSCVLRRLPRDWEREYGLAPLLAETLVDRRRFNGGCYRAANWIELGETTGRGRMDRDHQRQGTAVKTVWVYPLVKHALRRLRDG